MAPPRPQQGDYHHWVSGSTIGETCRVRGAVDNKPCGANAGHKLGEEIPHDDPHPMRHNLTAYVCCFHFKKILGPKACEWATANWGEVEGATTSD
jgi:hypothetical protein